MCEKQTEIILTKFYNSSEVSELHKLMHFENCTVIQWLYSHKYFIFLGVFLEKYSRAHMFHVSRKLHAMYEIKWSVAHLFHPTNLVPRNESWTYWTITQNCPHLTRYNSASNTSQFWCFSLFDVYNLSSAPATRQWNCLEHVNAL
jgi:hypothetical protein